ncbi:Rare lipoprotein A [Methylophaga lonarensis MPL]|uniref:Endolytic peptidoglycan transglycosylase RlpA n=1 Tax=Methylophaga lonarensis MPL TaxID=1286106 RepID=M7P1L5_9GAMM|nr:septal ring lytic transglycosylase RlpA family protein [Methylophaga lonarensis]EMR13381.1 Rare lipoprotein A [Methylophaga lonarensis MPL]
MKANFLRANLIALATLTLFACSGTPQREPQDSAPPPSQVPDIASIPDAVPKQEPLSRYGNMPSYEVFGKTYYTKASAEGYKERGVASWYGTKFHGRRTSSGEPYDMYAMTAAHKTLPLPTYAEVTNLENGRKVIVRINDRGPFVGDRIIDLSYTAAVKLGIKERGTGMVEVRAITPGGASPSTPRQPTETQTQTQAQPQPQKVAQTSPMDAGVYLQVGAFSTMSRAQEVKTTLEQQISDSVRIQPVSRPQGDVYRVRIGPLANVEQSDALADRLSRMGFAETQVVVE